jgi:hypothetical protein
MKNKKKVHINTLVNDYLEISKQINKSNEKLLNCDKGFFNQKLKAQLHIARDEHKNYSINHEQLDHEFVGDIEVYMHDSLAHLAIKDANYKVVSRARLVSLASLDRFEKTLVAIEDSLNFKISIKLAWMSIGVAVLSMALNFIGI